VILPIVIWRGIDRYNLKLSILSKKSIFQFKAQNNLQNIPLLPSPKDFVPQKHGGEKTTRHLKTSHPI
jgi:hypothetical protein